MRSGRAVGATAKKSEATTGNANETLFHFDAEPFGDVFGPQSGTGPHGSVPFSMWYGECSPSERGPE